MHASSCIVWERGNLGCSTIQITSQFYHLDIYCFKLQNSKFENQSRIKWAILQTCDHIACCTIVLLSRRSQMSKWGSVSSCDLFPSLKMEKHCRNGWYKPWDLWKNRCLGCCWNHYCCHWKGDIFSVLLLIKLEQYFISSTLSQIEDVSIHN